MEHRLNSIDYMASAGFSKPHFINSLSKQPQTDPHQDLEPCKICKIYKTSLPGSLSMLTSSFNRARSHENIRLLCVCCVAYTKIECCFYIYISNGRTASVFMVCRCSMLMLSMNSGLASSPTTTGYYYFHIHNTQTLVTTMENLT